MIAGFMITACAVTAIILGSIVKMIVTDTIRVRA
jgi:hypothetical protein